MTISLRITGKNADGEYWLHIDGSPQKAGLNLGDPAGMIASALLMAASGHTYIRTDTILSDPCVKALVEAATAVVNRWHQPTWKDAGPTGQFIGELEAALAALKGAT